MFLDVVRTLLASLLLAGAAFGAGHWIEKFLPATFSRLDRVACCWLGGFGVIGAILFLVGQFAFTPVIILLVLLTGALLAIAAFLQSRRLRGRMGEQGVYVRARELALGIPSIPAIVIGLVLVLTVVAAFADTVGDWGNDAVAYHLLGPRIWLREGVIRPVLDNSHTAFPPMAEVFYGALMRLGGPHGPGIFAVLSLLAFLLVLAAICIRLGLDANAAWWAVAFAICMPAVYTGAHSAFVDVFYASFVLAAARIGLDAERNTEFIAFGLLCGFAIATKYTGLLALAVLLMATVFARVLRGAESKLTPRGIGIALLTACVVGAPAYIRNWALLGCPIYPPPPLFASIFHAKYLSPAAIRNFHAYIYQRGSGLGRGVGAFLRLPINLTYHTANFHGAGGIGLCPLALGPLGVVAARKNEFAKALGLLAVLLTILWFITQQESRFLIHVYGTAAVFAALGWRYAQSLESRYSSALCAIVIACSLLYGLFMIVKSRADDVHSVFSASFAQRRRTELIPFYDSFAYLNRDPAVKKVLVLDRSVPPYYCEKEYVKPIGQWGEETLPGIRTTQDALQHLRELHVTHILDVSSGISGFQVQANTRGIELVFTEPNQRIYRATAAP